MRRCDPHKVDRVGALRARQLARSIVPNVGAEALVRVIWAPGLGRPRHLEVEVRDALGMRVSLDPDDLPGAEWFAIERSVRELEMAQPLWAEALRHGYFADAARSWESAIARVSRSVKRSTPRSRPLGV